MLNASPLPFIHSHVTRAVLSLFGLAVLGLSPGADAHAQTQSEPGLTLKGSFQLEEKPAEGPGHEVPAFISGDNINGRPNLETVVEGHAQLRRGTTALRADRIEYDQPEDTVKTRGNVRVSRSGNQYEGPELQLRMDTFEGFFREPTYRFLSGGNGKARRIDFIDHKRLVAFNATYTTCERDNELSWKPAWEIRADSFNFDFEEEIGYATGATLRFKDVPFLYIPESMTFPLSDKRKSGVLPPTIGIDTTSGLALTAPYYFDIAPNRDATVSPTYMSKRGLNLDAEYRYLEQNSAGQFRGNVLPNDALRDRNRWSYGLLHNASLDTGLPAVGNIGLNLNLNRASDNDYWRDFPQATTNLTPRLLPSNAGLSWGRGYFSTSVQALKWQTLQNLDSPAIVPPYDRLPQITARYGRLNAPVAGLGQGFDWSVDTDFTRFSSLSQLTNQPNADRAFMNAQLSRPWVWPAGYITPRLQFHATSYQFDTPLSSTGATSATRAVPTFSLDSGLQFEREAKYFGNGFIQTLEPRAFYVRTPYRDQSYLPRYDTGEIGFNFATVFTENPFVGNDRIADANLLTLGLTSRLINPDTGAEAVRLGIAQRLRFEDRRVSLTDIAPVSERYSDLLLGAAVNWTPQWALETAAQYNPKLRQSERSTFGVRYNPGNYRVISAAYRRQRDLSEQVDVGWQWPINDLWGDKGQELGAGRGQGGGRWYSVGRLNYSIPDKRLVDSVLGIEYDGCCWIGRVVLQRSSSSLATANTQIMFQLEFVGFTRLGNSPLGTLKNNVPRYQYLREQVTPPSRFTNYD